MDEENTFGSILGDIWDTTKNGFNKAVDVFGEIYTQEQTAKLRTLEAQASESRQDSLASTTSGNSASINPLWIGAGFAFLGLVLILRK